MTLALCKLIQVDVRRALRNQVAHLAPWLAPTDGLELPRDAIRTDVEIETPEDFSDSSLADLPAKCADTADEHRVVTENHLKDVISWA